MCRSACCIPMDCLSLWYVIYNRNVIIFHVSRKLETYLTHLIDTCHYWPKWPYNYSTAADTMFKCSTLRLSISHFLVLAYKGILSKYLQSTRFSATKKSIYCPFYLFLNSICSMNFLSGDLFSRQGTIFLHRGFSFVLACPGSTAIT